LLHTHNAVNTAEIVLLPPSVTSITRNSALNPINTASADFKVIFSTPVTGVDTGDFHLTTTGSLSGASITGVSGSGTTYIVTVNTGMNDGTLRLDLSDNDSIMDAASNRLGGMGVGNGDFNSGEVYNVLKVASFFDVPLNYWAWSWIERIYADGITTGCGASPLIYCPEAPVSRAQMAIFLLRSEHYGTAYTPPAATGTVFTDVPASAFAADWIEALKAENITTGCTATTYCPDADVTRAQMAVFLLRAEHGGAYAPPAATGLIFTDVPASAFGAAWIEQLYNEGVTTGCTATTYCPNSSVTRAQMAIFLTRTFGLP